jgi:putative hydrolase of the HAD superfamily
MHTASMSTQRNDCRNIKAVILDYGLVLARCPTREEFGRMAQIFDVSFELFYQLWETSRDLYDRGDLTAEEYWLKLAAHTDTPIDSAQIGFLRRVEVEIWSHPNPDMLDWVSKLRTSGIETALLSNMPLDLAAHVRTNCRWMENFTFKTLSAEVRLIKPDPAIYEHTLRGLGVAATEALFIDDREPNIRAAQTLGIHALQFSSVARLKNDLAVLGFPILPTVAESSLASSEESREERPGQGIKFQL